jgi:hypothetical protein
MCDRSAKHLGDNPRMKFFKAKVLAEQQASDVNISEAIQLLEVLSNFRIRIQFNI